MAEFIAYYRVSTDRQGASGLGLAAGTGRPPLLNVREDTRRLLIIIEFISICAILCFRRKIVPLLLKWTKSSSDADHRGGHAAGKV